MPASKRQAHYGATSDAKKRKKDPKWYAVRVGNRPGVYNNWPDCQRQITGYAGAKYKSFFTPEEAQAFVENREIAAKGRSPEPQKFYAVVCGASTGIYNDWDIVAKAIVGTKGPKYKKFDNRADAVAFIKRHGDDAALASLQDDSVEESEEESQDESQDDDQEEINLEFNLDEEEALEVEEPEAKDEDLEAKFGGLVKVETTVAKKTSLKPTKGVTQIYTDGSSLRNGQAGAAAGVGVYFGPNDARNVSEPLEGDTQTNQRAELTAILRALQGVPITETVQILTDSKYSINCATKWPSNWEKNHWKTKERKPVKNKELIQAIIKKMTERAAAGTLTTFIWVKGHANIPGNVAADHLAVAGSRKALPTKGRQRLQG